MYRLENHQNLKMSLNCNCAAAVAVVAVESAHVDVHDYNVEIDNCL